MYIPEEKLIQYISQLSAGPLHYYLFFFKHSSFPESSKLQIFIQVISKYLYFFKQALFRERVFGEEKLSEQSSWEKLVVFPLRRRDGTMTDNHLVC